jgi:hypothetical protein
VGLAIVPFEQIHRFRASDELSGRRIDYQSLVADAVTDIGLMHQQRAAMAFLRVGIGQLAAAQAADIILLVLRVRIAVPLRKNATYG